MNHNNYKYHILKITVPDSLMTTHGYPIKDKCFSSKNGLWIGFDGQKITDLESDFDSHLITDPPDFMTKTINMTQDEMKIIARNSLFRVRI